MVKWDITRDSGSRVVGSNPARRVKMLLYQYLRTFYKVEQHEIKPKKSCVALKSLSTRKGLFLYAKKQVG
jgi:hypothetical protein